MTSTATTLPRFDRLTRWVHWTTAAAGLIVLATATVLYVPELSASVGRRATIREIHVVTGLFLPIPLLFGLALIPAGNRLAHDLDDLGRWSPSDWRWLSKKRRGLVRGKFNGGQKLVTALFGGLFVMQLMTGSLMFWHDPFPTDWRTGATFVHDWAYLALAAAVLGHVVKALQEPELLQSMVRGDVPEEWASKQRPSWDAHASVPDRGRPTGQSVVARGTYMLVRLVGGIVLALIGIVWILQGLDIMGGSGMSGHVIWAVFGAVLLVVGVVLIRAANAVRARS